MFNNKQVLLFNSRQIGGDLTTDRGVFSRQIGDVKTTDRGGTHDKLGRLWIKDQRLQ